jgi:hypothetical protein
MDEPDYAESKASVFFNFTRSLVEWHNSLDILIEASFPAPPGSPTWVPDWSRPYSRPCVGQYNAAGSSQPNFKINHHELETSGKVLGEVDAVFQKPTLSSASPILSFVQFETRKWKGFGWGGLGPSSMQSGDILALISGLCVPMLLRPSRQSDFEVIGLAIVDGIMQGEAWPGNASQLDSFKLV